MRELVGEDEAGADECPRLERRSRAVRELAYHLLRAPDPLLRIVAEGCTDRDAGCSRDRVDLQPFKEGAQLVRHELLALSPHARQ